MQKIAKSANVQNVFETKLFLSVTFASAHVKLIIAVYVHPNTCAGITFNQKTSISKSFSNTSPHENIPVYLIFINAHTHTHKYF